MLVLQQSSWQLRTIKSSCRYFKPLSKAVVVNYHEHDENANSAEKPKIGVGSSFPIPFFRKEPKIFAEIFELFELFDNFLQFKGHAKKRFSAKKCFFEKPKTNFFSDETMEIIFSRFSLITKSRFWKKERKESLFGQKKTKLQKILNRVV